MVKVKGKVIFKSNFLTRGQSESPKSTESQNRSLSKPLSCTIKKARKQTRRKESKEAPRRTMMKKARNTSRRI